MNNQKTKVFLLLFFAIIVLFFVGGNSANAVWNPPIGIPAPLWPTSIDAIVPTFPSLWIFEQIGYYYIERSDSGCSDTRAYGYPGSARCSLPSSPAAGSVIVIDGIYTPTNGPTVAWNGSPNNEIWIRAYDFNDKPTIGKHFNITGSYIIIDGLSWDYNQDAGVSLAGNHIMVRNSSHRNPYDTDSGSAFGISGDYIIFYNNKVYDQGNWQYPGAQDIDRHGIKVSEVSGSTTDGADDVWIVDNTFYHLHGDSVQVGDYNNAPNQINRIYIGRNVAYENYAVGFWTKNATDVIFSENTIYNQTRATGWGVAGGLGGQYDPKYVWYLNNKVYNSNTGIRINGGAAGGGGPWYAIGNLIYNIEYPVADCNEYNYGALGYRNDGGFYAFSNTIYDVDSYFTLGPGETAVARNNIFANQKTTTSCPAIDTQSTAIMDHNLYGSNDYDVSYGGSNYATVSAFAAARNQEANRKVGDSLFINVPTDFSLQSTSIAIDAANQFEESAFSAYQSRYGINIRKDIAGIVRPQGSIWDIGAYEYVQASPPSIYPKGDFNQDTKVNDLDFTSFKSAFKSIFNAIFDLNADNSIDVRDLGVLMSGWLP